MLRKYPTHQEIAARAYLIYLDSGCQHGHDLDNWLQAEYELMQMPIRELAKQRLPRPAQGQPKRRSIIEVVQAVLW